MNARTRIRTNEAPKGTAQRFGEIRGGYPITIGKSTCTDVTGKLDNQYFDVNSWYGTGGRLNGTAANGSTWNNYHADYYDNFPAGFPHIISTLLPSGSWAATSAAARTNPSSAYVDVPVAILELGDIVQLIRDSGRSLIRKAAGANIKYEFGIAPLASDLAKLLNVEQQTARKAAVIEKLKSKGGYRRTVLIGTYNGASQKSIPAQSTFTSVSVMGYGYTVSTMRAHCRWSPTADLSKFDTPERIRALARSAVLGLKVDLSTAWELIPWSWLIDYGTNIGTYLKAHRNIIPSSLSEVTVMTEHRTRWECDPSRYVSTPLKLSAYTHTSVSKARRIVGVGLSANQAFLNARQVGILGSLSVLSGKRR